MTDITIIILGTFIFIALAVTIALSFMLYQKSILKERNKAQLLELDLQNRVIAAIIDTEEIERKRLSDDLHDEMGAVLLALKLGNHDLMYKDGSENFESRILKNEKLIDTIAERVRSVSHNLLPPSLRKGHLVSAFSALCNLFRQNSNLNIKFRNENNELHIPTKDQIYLYRIVNEWFANIVKHSGANTIEFIFYKLNSNYILDITDNGKGFDFDKSITESKGLGLMSMRGRLMQIGAEYSFDKNNPHGTIFKIIYPVKL